jgi:hypothetical protein
MFGFGAFWAVFLVTLLPAVLSAFWVIVAAALLPVIMVCALGLLLCHATGRMLSWIGGRLHRSRAQVTLQGVVPGEARPVVNLWE